MAETTAAITCTTADNLTNYANIAQVITPIIAIVAIFVTWWIYLRQKNREQRERSIEIGANIETVRHMMGYLNAVLSLESEELVDILLKADRFKMNEFISSEISQVYTEEQLELLNRYFPPSPSYLSNLVGPKVDCKISSDVLLQCRKKYYKLFSRKLSDFPVDIGERNQLLAQELQEMIIDTLNRFETLCLMMCENVAKEKLIYKVVSKNFLPFVSLFYYYIAKVNDTAVYDEKIMKHVIIIFNKWKCRAYMRSISSPIKRISSFQGWIRSIQNSVLLWIGKANKSHD